MPERSFGRHKGSNRLHILIEIVKHQLREELAEPILPEYFKHQAWGVAGPDLAEEELHRFAPQPLFRIYIFPEEAALPARDLALRPISLKSPFKNIEQPRHGVRNLSVTFKDLEAVDQKYEASFVDFDDHSAVQTLRDQLLNIWEQVLDFESRHARQRLHGELECDPHVLRLNELLLVPLLVAQVAHHQQENILSILLEK